MAVIRGKMAGGSSKGRSRRTP